MKSFKEKIFCMMIRHSCVVKQMKKEIEHKAIKSTKYVACGLYEALDIINRYLEGE